jgi:NDP-sugar pyrophosphorylase family protein
VKEAARAAGATGTLVVCNGDILTNVDLSSMLRRHRETGATLSMSLAPVDDPWAYGVVEVMDDLRILSFVEKPPQGEEPSNLINAGTWLWEPPMLERIADDESAVRDGFSERVLFPGIIADGLRVQGFVEDLWVDCGSPERVLRATRLLLERRARDEGAGPWIGAGADVHASGQVGERVLIGAGAVVEAGAVLGGDTVIGERTRVGEGAAIDDSVVWEDGDIGNGVAARGSIIADGVVVGDGASMVDAVIASRARVAAGAQLPDGARVEPDGSV